jgi:hypothetical protein
VNQLENTKDPLHISSGLIGFSGSMFTRTNWQCNKPILEKLDWVLVNMKWKCEFSTSKAYLSSFWHFRSFSDVKKASEHAQKKNSFQVFWFWADHPQFNQTIAEAWEMEVFSTRLYCVGSWSMLRLHWETLIRNFLQRFRIGFHIAKKAMEDAQSMM